MEQQDNNNHFDYYKLYLLKKWRPYKKPLIYTNMEEMRDAITSLEGNCDGYWMVGHNNKDNTNKILGFGIFEGFYKRSDKQKVKILKYFKNTGSDN